MGYKEGGGLGKHGQGITTPVEAVKRKGKAAVGAYGTERSERSLVDFPVHDSDEEEEKRFKEELSQWKKKPEASGILHCFCALDIVKQSTLYIYFEYTGDADFTHLKRILLDKPILVS